MTFYFVWILIPAKSYQRNHRLLRLSLDDLCYRCSDPLLERFLVQPALDVEEAVVALLP